MLLTPNATLAYRRAGGTATTDQAARQGAYQLLTNSDVQAALAAEREKRAARVRVEADWVIQEIVGVLERCKQAEPVYDAEGNPTGVYRFDSSGALKALDMLAKHLGMYEKDNRQRVPQPQDLEESRERLRSLGFPVDKFVPPPRRTPPPDPASGNGPSPPMPTSGLPPAEPGCTSGT
jgi:phage terminase small subunit